MQIDIIPLLIVAVCVVMSAYFSATETAFSSLNRIKLKNMAEKGNKRAELTLRLSQNYDAMLSTILIGNNIVNIAAASLATVLFVQLLGQESGPGISTLLTTVVVLIFGEVSPKSIAKEAPERFAMFSAPLLRVFIIGFTPVNFLFKQWKKLLSRIFKCAEDSSITEEELLSIVEEAQQGGGINAQESELIRNAIEFSELQAGGIMTPRPDVVGVTIEMDKEKIAQRFAETGFSRLPIYQTSLDHILGVIYQKDFHNKVYRAPAFIESIIRPVLFCTENQKVGLLLKELQKNKLHIAVVVDEFGGTAGIVTLEDVLEELVGEIWDEHDEVVQTIRNTGEGRYEVLGGANLEDVLEQIGCEQQFEAVTVGGWVMERLGRIPQEGDQFECSGLRTTVQKVEGRRVEKVCIEKQKLDVPEEK